jgi:hypothetical protein
MAGIKVAGVSDDVWGCCLRSLLGDSAYSDHRSVTLLLPLLFTCEAGL